MKGGIGPPGNITSSSGDVLRGPAGPPGPQVIIGLFCVVMNKCIIFLQQQPVSVSRKFPVHSKWQLNLQRLKLNNTDVHLACFYGCLFVLLVTRNFKQICC